MKRAEKSGGNVFSDLGLPHPEERKRLADKFAKRKDGHKLFLAAVAALALSGCQTTRWVTVPCVAKDQTIPQAPPKVAPILTGRADEDLRIVSGSALRLRSWGEGLSLILEGCRAKS